MRVSGLAARPGGPRRENIPGTLRDPFAGVLARFGAAGGDRPGREDVFATAFFGAVREAMGGVFERSDLGAGFGGVR